MTASFLLHTQIILWAAGQPNRLASEVRTILEDPSNPVFVSSVSIAEMVIKQSIGKLSLVTSDEQVLAYPRVALLRN
jgi:PIN domain nuclease of toxin-antitoxin system